MRRLLILECRESKGWTFKEIGQVFNISTARARQIVLRRINDSPPLSEDLRLTRTSTLADQLYFLDKTRMGQVLDCLLSTNMKKRLNG